MFKVLLLSRFTLIVLNEWNEAKRWNIWNIWNDWNGWFRFERGNAVERLELFERLDLLTRTRWPAGADTIHPETTSAAVGRDEFARKVAGAELNISILQPLAINLLLTDRDRVPLVHLHRLARNAVIKGKHPSRSLVSLF